MFVVRYVIEQLPLSGDSPLSVPLNLQVPKGYTPLLRRITYSLDRGYYDIDDSLEATPKIEIAVQTQNDYQVREGGDTYIGGIVIQPIINYVRSGEASMVAFIMPVWGQRSFFALEERYILDGSYLVVSVTDYNSSDLVGIRIEYTQEKLSGLELAQANFR